MDKTLSVTLVANGGLLLEYGGTRMLLDGIFGREGHPFSAPSPETLEKLAAGEEPFGQIDVLLFSHNHPDHFSPELTLAFLKRRPVRGVFLPDSRTVTESGLPAFLAERNIPCAQLSDQTDRMGFRITPEITVRAFRTLHLDRKFEKVKHFCYLISFGGKNLLFTADLDYVTEDLSRLNGVPLEAVFLNPLFFGALSREKFFRGQLEPRQFLVYHVPFPGEDTMGIRTGLEKDLARWPAEKPPVTVLDKPLQRVYL